MREMLITAGILLGFLALLIVAAPLSLWLGEWAFMLAAAAFVAVGLAVGRIRRS